MSDLTPFDTGATLEPHRHRDTSGKVDFDNEGSETEVMLSIYPSTELPDTLILEIDSGMLRELKIVVNDGDVATINQDGAPRPHAPELTAEQDAKLYQFTQLRNALVDAESNGAETIDIDDVISDLNVILAGKGVFA